MKKHLPFFSTWNEFNKILKTLDFTADLDFIINNFRSKDRMLQTELHLGCSAI